MILRTPRMAFSPRRRRSGGRSAQGLAEPPLFFDTPGIRLFGSSAATAISRRWSVEAPRSPALLKTLLPQLEQVGTRRPSPPYLFHHGQRHLVTLDPLRLARA
jgi:hypothetical protein